MSHKYSNFAEAFADLTSELELWPNQYGIIANICDDARDFANSGNYKWGIYRAVQAVQYLADVHGYFIDMFYGGVEDSHFAESLYWAAHEPKADELSMETLLDTLWAAEPYQCLLFIPMIDAMRGSIQKKTVTTQWMANALRHFL